jgi:hypothetical protein
MSDHCSSSGATVAGSAWPPFRAVHGVDFSGARLAGRTTWLARLEPGAGGGPALRLAELHRLERLCGTAEREGALAHLVECIAESQEALWALDFPFGLPVEVVEEGATWADQLEFLHGWGPDAYGLGLECLRRAKLLGGPNHIRRQTDDEAGRPSTPTTTASSTRRSTACVPCCVPWRGCVGLRSYPSTTGVCRPRGGCWWRRARPRR